MLFKTICFTILCAVWAQQNRIMVILSPAQVSDFRGSAETCGKEYGVDPKDLRKIMTWPLSDDLAHKQFLHCIFYTTGYVDADGHLVIEKVQTYTPINGTLEDTRKAYEKCNELTRDNYLDTTYATAICFHEYIIPVIVKTPAT